MNKLISLILITSYMISGCRFSDNQSTTIDLTIDNFLMDQFNNKGIKSYTIYSPKSTYDNKSNRYELDETIINFYENENIKYKIKSENAFLINNNSILKLSGNVSIKDLTDISNKITADSFYWDINKSEFILEGNVILDNNNVNLKSSKAFLDKNTNIIKFYKPVKYNYKDNNSSAEYKVSANNAYYNIKDQSVSFTSDKQRVKSKIVF